MARFLLVHGSNHGAWCWRDLLPALDRLGHRAEAVDLPSVSPDPAALTDIALDDDAAAIRAALTRPTVLVGHSAAGFAITRAAQLVPETVAALVYLCAYVPRPDASVARLAKQAPGHPLDGALEIDRTHRAYRFRDAALAANLYGDCPAGTLDYARPRLGWQATLAQSAVLAPPPASMPLHYISCLNDRTIPPAQQAEMAGSLPGVTRHSLDTGHSPFFAAPDRLAALLDRLARALAGGPA
ncbi:MAG: alpha/beta fold hydrolase [Maritimibacter sp.]|nr:alpha/beta fold hydrolase [Maritimibacter sp.]